MAAHTKDEPLILVGCAPCQGFSAHRKKDKEKPEDQRNSLIRTFAQLAIQINPDYIVMENVQEVLNGKFRCHYEEAKAMLEENDKARSEYYYKHAGKVWGDVNNYHMILDTSQFGIENCANILMKYFERIEVI